MPRSCLPRPAAPRGAGLLLAACCGLGVGFGCTVAGAQSALTVPSTAAPYTNPLTPDLQASTASQPQRFEKSSRASRSTRKGQPRTFKPLEPLKPLKPPPSGAGTTGFNATNAPARRKSTSPSAYRSAAPEATPYGGAASGASAGNGTDTAQAGTLAAPQSLSPYQQPIPPLSGDQAMAQAPGEPPVPNISPIRKPKKKRRAHPDEPIDPFAPAGVRAGSFDVYPSIELKAGYDSNPNQSESGSGATVYTVEPEVKVQSDWSRHSLKAELRGSYTGYSPDSTPTLSRPYVNGKVDGRIDASRDTKINLGGRVLVSTDNPGSPNLQVGLSKLPVFATFGGSAGVTRSFNRFELKLTGDAERTAYQNSELTDGTTASNKERNYNQFGGTLRGSYEVLPGVKPFIEVGADTRIHDEEPDANGYKRNSNGITAQVGTTFELTRVLTGEISAGYTRRNYDDPRFGSLGGFVGNASLIWNADALNTLKLTAKSTVGESTVAGVSGIFYRDLALQYDHAFRRWLIGSLKLGLGVDSYDGGSTSSSSTDICTCVVTTVGDTTPDRQDERYSVGFGLTYKFSRELWLNGEFQQKWVRSNVAGNDYDDSLFLFGIKLQR